MILLIHTFNQYEFLWDGCLKAWEKYDQEFPIYFGTDTEGHKRTDFGKMKVIYSGVGSWSDRLTNLLTKIDSKYVLYVQEDHWPYIIPNFGKFLDLVQKYDLLRLQIAENHRYYTTYERDGLHFFDLKSKYLVSHQPSIWDRKFFLQQIQYNETPWINEYEGSKRLKNDHKIRDKIAIYPVRWYHHACIRGKLIEIKT